uniref:Uncharacterized protein n=1 Tax=Siphoviridae sp. ctAFE3 TaxID=2827796 RepID=A0A8S5S7Q6_9CAUD|nr:MAG TPA: hypothetical protein [Siphoviridae sp. ctAFE3]
MYIFIWFLIVKIHLPNGCPLSIIGGVKLLL